MADAGSGTGTVARSGLWAFYLEGREDASEEFSTEEFDTSAIAQDVIQGGDVAALRDVCLRVIDSDLATDAHDGTKTEWIAEHVAACGRDVERAYEWWRAGYAAEAAMVLEADVVNEIAEWIAVTGTEAPAAKKASAPVASPNPSPNPIDRAPSYADWYATGQSDAANSWDADELDDELRTAADNYYNRPSWGVTKHAHEAVAAYWRVVGEEQQTLWMTQHADDVQDDGLVPKQAWKSWEAGLLGQYERYAAEAILRMSEQIEADE
jgi:hypothetical protein